MVKEPLRGVSALRAVSGAYAPVSVSKAWGQTFGSIALRSNVPSRDASGKPLRRLQGGHPANLRLAVPRVKCAIALTANGDKSAND